MAPVVVELDERQRALWRQNWALPRRHASFPGGAVGLLGPNGAGKSTMIKALLGFVTPEPGPMRVLGLDVRHAPLEIRARIGYMPESDAHIPGMNAVSFVAYCGELSGLPRPTRCSARTKCCTTSASARRATGTSRPYSTGMKQRIKLAQALVHDPDLLFLDEPTNGMDPKGRDEMLELDSRHRAQQGGQPDSVIAPVAGRRVHLRPRRRDGQGRDRDRRVRSRAERAGRAASSSCGSRETADASSACCARPASSATPPTRT